MILYLYFDKFLIVCTKTTNIVNITSVSQEIIDKSTILICLSNCFYAHQHKHVFMHINTMQNYSTLESILSRYFKIDMYKY